MKVILRATKETMQHIAKYRRSLFVMIIFIWITGVLAPFLQVVLPSLFLYLIETQQSFADTYGLCRWNFAVSGSFR